MYAIYSYSIIWVERLRRAEKAVSQHDYSQNAKICAVLSDQIWLKKCRSIPCFPGRSKKGKPVWKGRYFFSVNISIVSCILYKNVVHRRRRSRYFIEFDVPLFCYTGWFTLLYVPHLKRASGAAGQTPQLNSILLHCIDDVLIQDKTILTKNERKAICFIYFKASK